MPSNYFKTQYVRSNKARNVRFRCSRQQSVGLNYSKMQTPRPSCPKFYTRVDCFKKGNPRVSVTPKCREHVSDVIKKEHVLFQLTQIRSKLSQSTNCSTNYKPGRKELSRETLTQRAFVNIVSVRNYPLLYHDLSSLEIHSKLLVV